MQELDFKDTNAYVTANDLVEGLCLREGDNDLKKKPLYLFLFKEVYQDLNMAVIRQTERVLLRVDQATKRIYAPDGYLYFSSISAPNKHGKFEPLIVNSSLDTDIIDIGASKKCGCSECACDNEYCSSVRNYELISSIVTAKLPNGTPKNFTATERKKILRDGTYVREVTTPVQIFENDIHTETILQTTTEILCHLEIEECGCLKKTPKNERLLLSCSDSVTVAYDCGCPIRELRPDAHYYKISDKGNTIQLPFDFPYETVLLRFYADVKTREIRVPFLAQKAMRFGIKAEETTYSEPGTKQNQLWIRLYGLEKVDLGEKISKLKLKDFLKYVVGTFNVL